MYLRELLGREDGAPPPVDLNAEKAHAGLVRGLITAGKLATVHDLSDGGLVAAAAEMALASGVGILLNNPTKVADHGFYFGEDQARYLVAVDADWMDELDAACEAAGAPYEIVGEAGGCELALRGGAGALAAVDLDDLRSAHEGWMPDYMGRVE
jgi:phosphoribosylformylglycinamidine synthase